MHEDSRERKTIQWIGLILGPLLAVVALAMLPDSFPTVDLPPTAVKAKAEIDAKTDADLSPADESVKQEATTQEFSWAGRATLAVMIWMAVWWLTEAIDICATALLPIVLFPFFRATSISEATLPYANPLIFLFVGGFIIALAMERWGLGKRAALITLRTVGSSTGGIIAGFMLVTAVLSAFVSNTATTAMMLPIAMSLVALLKQNLTGGAEGDTAGEDGKSADQFATCLMLAIAYSASVGGIMTIIGTPTNAFLVGFLHDSIGEEFRQDMTFVRWLPIGVAFAVAFLPVLFFMLTRLLYPIGGISIRGGSKLIETELGKLGPMKRGEWVTLIVFGVTVLLWLTRPLLKSIQLGSGETVFAPFANWSDTGIAMLGAMLLFVIPVDLKNREFAMDWKTAQRLPWGIILLFGGGLSLAAAVQANGVAEFIGSLTGNFRALPPIALVLIVVAGIVFLTELTSNVATTTSLVPVLAALAPGLGIHPYLLIFPATVAASCAFMLPVATPPNAIVFGSGAVTMPQMAKAGFWLNLVAILAVTLLAMLVVKPYFGI